MENIIFHSLDQSTVVNRTLLSLPGGYFKITLTSPLKGMYTQF